jgi:hypothetical protein
LADTMRAQAQQAGVSDRLVFADPTPRIDDYYRSADVFALPSSREGLPVALLEAMATGLPVVASRLPGSTDTIVDDGRTGVLVTPGDASALAGAIRALAERSRVGGTMGERATSPVESDFGADRTARGGWTPTFPWHPESHDSSRHRRRSGAGRLDHAALPDILCISSIDWDFIWQGHQEIMSSLAAGGRRVLFLENTACGRCGCAICRGCGAGCATGRRAPAVFAKSGPTSSCCRRSCCRVRIHGSRPA